MTLFVHRTVTLGALHADVARTSTADVYVSARDATTAAALISERCQTPIKIACVQPVHPGDRIAGILTAARLVSHNSPKDSVVIVGRSSDDGLTRVVGCTVLAAGVAGYIVGTGNRLAFSTSRP